MAQQRRIDRILADDYLDGLEERSTDEIRRLRDECEEEESGISYARRVVQARIDMLRAEATRRHQAGNEAARSILDVLPQVLADEDRTSSPAQARPTRYLVPPAVHYHRREVDRIADDEALTRLGDRSAEELAAIAERLAAKERELSLLRRQLLDRIDRLQAELIRRYKSGAADVADVLT